MEEGKKEEEDDLQVQIIQNLSQEQLIALQQQRLNHLNNFYKNSKKYEISYWYKTLEQFTLYSKSFQLNTIQAYLLCSIYYEEEQKLNNFNKFKQDLSLKVNHFMQYDMQAKQCFMKLATRSPKDYAWCYKNETQQQQLGQKLAIDLKNTVIYEEVVEKQTITAKMSNYIYRWLLDNCKNQCKVKNGDDFIRIFSQSQRIIIDLTDFSSIRNKVFEEIKKQKVQIYEQPFIQIWGRKWINCSWFQQFRCFYHNYQLLGISQYDERCYFPQLQNQQERIKQIIIPYFQLLKPALTSINLSQGVLDLIICYDKISCKFINKPILLQINIFNQSTRGSLFSWSNEDLFKLQKQVTTRQNLSCRFKKQPQIICKSFLQTMMGMLDHGIGNILMKTMVLLHLEYLWNNYN